MNSYASFRVRLAVALGLPLVPACTSASEQPTTTPTTTPTATPTATTTSSRCAADQIHERACGLVDSSFAGGGGPAPPPHQRCTVNGLTLWDVQTDHMIDGWKVSSHDKVLAEFKFDAAATTAFKYEGTYQPEEQRCCYDRCNPIQSLAKPRASVPKGMKEYELCIPSPVSTKFPAAGAKQCPAALRTRQWYPYGAQDPLDDAPFARALDDQCCYSVASAHRCPPNTFETEKGGCEEPSPGGRPLREAGAVVVAPTRARDGWHAAITFDPARWTAAVRAYAAVAWAREAAFEHASVAAFARLAIELMVHGAPAELVDAAHVAARDEIRHAQQCYGIASTFGGSRVGPGELALATSSRAATLEDLAVEWFRDGCVNETVAALSVSEASRLAATRALRETLAAIAEDEARHAELSYQILAWTLREGGAAVRVRIVDELATLRAELSRAATAGDAPRDHDEATGLLAPRTAGEIRRRVLATVVIPCTEALLG